MQGQEHNVTVQSTLIDSVKVLRPTRHKIGHLRDVLPSQSLDVVFRRYQTNNISLRLQSGRLLSKYTDRIHDNSADNDYDIVQLVDCYKSTLK